MELKVGLKYKVESTGTNKYETWTIKEIKENKHGDVEVTASGDRTTFLRTFTPDKFKELDKKMSKEIITETGGVAITLEDGTEALVENIINWPAQERRGRKPKV